MAGRGNSTSLTLATSPGGLVQCIAEGLPDCALLIDEAGLLVFVNHETERQFGFSREQLVGQHVELILPGAADLQRGLSQQRETIATSFAAGPRRLVGRRSDNSEFPVDVSVNFIAVANTTCALAVVDATHRNRTESGWGRTLEGKLEFERVVADLSARFINLPVDRVDDEVRDALRRIGEALDLDRCTFFRLSLSGATDPVCWQRPGISPPPQTTSARFPFPFETVLSGRVLCFSSVDEIPNPTDREACRALGIRSSVTVPVFVGGRVVGAVGFNLYREERAWPPDLLDRLSVFATVFGNDLARRDSEEALHRALAEAKHLRAQLHHENLYLRAEARGRVGSASIVGQSQALNNVQEQVQQVAPTGSTVLLLGETGTGKELFATRIHELSSRRGRAMVRVNCSAIPSTLIESELFGREKGAFTGALARQVGRFELADQSTIFLDEIGELPLEIQVKLLRVLEERQIERLGNPKPIRVDTRIIVATHRNLEQRIAEGSFREDLFYRLNVFPIRIPPLRERAEDIPLLVWRFVEEFSRAFGKTVDAIPRANLEALQRYHWPGNIRELRNVVESAMIVATGSRLTIAVPTQAAPQKPLERLDAVEKEHIRRVLEITGWRIRGSGGAAERLGMRPTTLETRMAKLGLKRPGAR
jgi:formate hydrogenlyase transcriptional activator